MTLFIGPVAESGGPAIKNSIMLKYLFPEGGYSLVNTQGHDLASRLSSVIRTIASRDRQAIVAVSRKGRAVLWPIVHWKAKKNPSFKYALICIGGTIAVEASTNRRLVDSMQAASIVAVETRGVAEQLGDLGIDGTHLMTNYVDNLSVRRRPSKPSEQASLRFVFLSSVRNKKGVRTMLEAFRKALASGLDASLDIYGPIRADFDRSILEGIRENEPIAYKGTVPNADVIETLAAYDCFVFPSEYEAEGFPAVLAEAMAAGLPILASDICYNPEIVVDDRNGWIFPSGNVPALAALFARCGERREDLSRMALTNFTNCLRFDAETVVGEFRNALIDRGWSL